jgi:hypothetical protein
MLPLTARFGLTPGSRLCACLCVKKLPLVGKLSPKVTDEVSLVSLFPIFMIESQMRFSCSFASSKKLSAEVRLSDPIDSDKDGNCLTLADI